MLNVFSVMVPALVDALKITKETRTKDVDQSVYSALTVQRTKLVSETNAKIHVPEFAAKMLNVFQ